MATAAEEPRRSLFLELPPEIRENIYHLILCSKYHEEELDDERKKYNFDMKIYLVNKQIHHEARRVFRRSNVFAVVETPWVEAIRHVNVDGHVPIVAKGEAALLFTDYHLLVNINVPQFNPRGNGMEMYRFVLMLDDLPGFTTMWTYSDLTHQNLNEALRLTLTLKYPYDGEIEPEKQHIPKAMQRKLLHPFGRLKKLEGVFVLGDHDPDLVAEMRAHMKQPYMSMEECLSNGFALKDQGNALLKEGKYRDAIKLYIESFRAIHIVCAGRARHVWGDAVFLGPLRSGQFATKDAATIRLLLRVRLVANVVLAYLQLKEYDDARFWGMRTIGITREALQNIEFMPNFVAATEMGKIYYRTAQAYKELGDEGEARALLRVAVQYLPRDGKVHQALASVALKLG